MGDPVPISVPALLVRGLPQDLIGGKAVNKINIRVILDDDPDICGLYPLTKDMEQHYQESFEFVSEYFSICSLKKWIGPDLMQRQVMKYGTNDLGTYLFGILSRPFNTRLDWKN